MKQAPADIELVVTEEVMSAGAAKVWQKGINKYLIGLGVLAVVTTVFVLLLVNG